MGRAKRSLLQWCGHTRVPAQVSVSLSLLVAGALHPSKAEDPVSPSIGEFARDLNINTVSLPAAVKEAIATFDALPGDVSKTFVQRQCIERANVASIHVARSREDRLGARCWLAACAFAGKGYKAVAPPEIFGTFEGSVR
jgi:hypothetical protein